MLIQNTTKMEMNIISFTIIIVLTLIIYTAYTFYTSHTKIKKMYDEVNIEKENTKKGIINSHKNITCQHNNELLETLSRSSIHEKWRTRVRNELCSNEHNLTY